MSPEELFARGGVVVWILAGYSVLALAIALERALLFLTLGRPPRALETRVQEALESGTAKGLLDGVKGPEAAVMRALVEAAGQGIRDLGRVASRVGSRELQRMERGFRTLAFLGNTAPLLGLFGTILGMIKAFMVIEQAGGRVDAQALAGGIWEAMITTGIGLAVSIPILLLLHFLESLADRRAHAMRNHASLLIERLPHLSEMEEEEPVHHREGIAGAL